MFFIGCYFDFKGFSIDFSYLFVRFSIDSDIAHAVLKLLTGLELDFNFSWVVKIVIPQ